ncbi:MAG: prepilin peptidase [Deltaproteobacteria bacterium]|nr:MAG: prepilin peptidase [Deltaproteobacteria bacterium]
MIPDPYCTLSVLVFAVGLCIGSFLNVCIYRIPESVSVVFPPSACPACHAPIRWYDNIPVLSYLVLRARCRRCQTAIPLRYPLIELLTGLSALAAYFTWGPGISLLVYFTFIAVMILITFIDIDHQIIPNAISLPGIPIFYAAAFLVPGAGWDERLIGILIGGGSLWTVNVIYRLVKRMDGMGGGDVKLLALIGGFIGWQGVFFTIFISSAAGSLIGLFIMCLRRKSLTFAIPFGPFLALGGVLYIFFGSELINWYLHLGY